MNPLLFKEDAIWLLPLIVWSLFWKGLALWTAVKNDQKKWFLAILILNTAGILDIIYYFGVAKKKWGDVTDLFVNLSSKISPPAPPAQ
ncbi:MAG: DUF5652 family protein [bacterium]|nr:DUF5652 family protein [bacterium]